MFSQSSLFISLVLACVLMPVTPVTVAAEDAVSLKITLENHRFSPAELHAPAGKALVIAVTNNDDVTEEFESYDFDREQRIKAKETGLIKLGPMKPGRYPFFGDFHRKTAQGVLVVE